MPSWMELFERQALRCVELADRVKEPDFRELLLLIARDWMQGAEVLRQAASTSAPPTPDDDPSDQRAA
jgi:hypothetical protein